ncbi:MAG: amino acid ABC transporter ATP-binding protein [Bacteroidetes bacterium]|nr:amino acid ABC transporter ATP-binding protein [Bacteroidota bacterium]
MISIKDLHKHFPKLHVLKGIDLQVKKGQLISIIGRSGCGKTTLLRCLNCLEFFDSGTLRIAGITLTRAKSEAAISKSIKQKSGNIRKGFRTPFKPTDDEAELDDDFHIKVQILRSRVGMLFQNLNLFPHLTVMENVAKAPIIVKGEEKEKSIRRAIQLLEKVGLKDFMKRYPYQLSGGQAQRVAIARALAMSPHVMLYDEPTSALDPELVEEVLQVMRNLHKEGMTQIIVTHAMHFARTASDMVVYMEDGKIIESGPPEEIFSNAKDPRTKQYLSIVKD